MEFQLERSGFPIKIGELEFFFGTEVEELLRFFDVQDELEVKQKELSKQQEELKNIDNSTKEYGLLQINLLKEVLKAKYDALLGDGSFAKLYGKYPYISQLDSLFDTLEFEVAEEIEREATKRQNEVIKRKNDLLKKKALKNKKKK
ncbi:hypothetical protein NG876_12560 [Enterococcus faecium]|uniref:hypothetical protein n=1 Tax=Enterococcus faecium TaxID=1352 RepID=UPI002090695F|nr:hypothetical protein [Enterococcus faecium]MCO5468794.1 hypothetical protein [Enterococcus faecium]